jgi:hypothetical protein
MYMNPRKFKTYFGDFRIDFLGEYDAKFETTLAVNQGPVELIDEKIEGRKSRVPVPLRVYILQFAAHSFTVLFLWFTLKLIHS